MDQGGEEIRTNALQPVPVQRFNFPGSRKGFAMVDSLRFLCEEICYCKVILTRI